VYCTCIECLDRWNDIEPSVQFLINNGMLMAADNALCVYCILNEIMFVFNFVYFL
jgi:hypothetical protein